MKVKICPLCDSEMKKAHYCETCNSFIWKPELLDVHYNSESRGMGEVDCAYGSNHDRYDHYESGRSNKKKPDHRRSINNTNRTAKASNSHHEVFGSSMKKKTDDSKNKKGIISKIIAIVISFNVIGSLLGVAVDAIDTYGFENAVESFFDSIGIDIELDQGSTAEDIYAETEKGFDDSFENNYVEISDEELADYPDGCNGYSHFGVTSDELLPQIEKWIEDSYGEGSVTETYINIDNYRYVYSDDLEYVYLAKTKGYNVPNDDDGYIEVSYDTVTERVHSISVSYLSPKEMEMFFRNVVVVLSNGITESEIEEGITMLFDDEIEDYNSGVIGNLYVFAMENGDGTLWLDISPAE